MTWLGQWAEWGWCISSSGPYRQDYSNRDEVSEWGPATPGQPYEPRYRWIRRNLGIQGEQLDLV